MRLAGPSQLWLVGYAAVVGGVTEWQNPTLPRFPFRSAISFRELGRGGRVKSWITRVTTITSSHRFVIAIFFPVFLDDHPSTLEILYMCASRHRPASSVPTAYLSHRSPPPQGFALFSMARYLVNAPSNPHLHRHPRHPLSRQLVLQVLYPDRRPLHPIPHISTGRFHLLSMDSHIRRFCRDPFLRGPSPAPISPYPYSCSR